MTKLAILFLLVGISTGAQELPFRPERTISLKLTCGPDVLCQARYGVSAKAYWYEQLRVEHRTADRKWNALTAASAALTIADVENSIYALRSSRAREVNPIFGAHPTRLRYYAITAPIAGTMAYLSWRWKREDDALRDAGIPTHRGINSWWLPEAANAGLHAVGILVTVGATRR